MEMKDASPRDQPTMEKPDTELDEQQLSRPSSPTPTLTQPTSTNDLDDLMEFASFVHAFVLRYREPLDPPLTPQSSWQLETALRDVQGGMANTVRSYAMDDSFYQAVANKFGVTLCIYDKVSNDSMRKRFNPTSNIVGFQKNQTAQAVFVLVRNSSQTTQTASSWFHSLDDPDSFTTKDCLESIRRELKQFSMDWYARTPLYESLLETTFDCDRYKQRYTEFSKLTHSSVGCSK